MNIDTLISSLRSIDQNTISVIGVAVSILASIAIAYCSRPKAASNLRMFIGMAATLGYRRKKHPIHHTIYLVDGAEGGVLPIPFIVHNDSTVTARNVTVQIDLPTFNYISTAEMKKHLMNLEADSEILELDILKSRQVSKFGSMMRVHYKIDEMHPGTSVCWHDLLSWTAYKKKPGYHIDNFPPQEYSETGFFHSLKRIWQLEGFRSFVPISLSFYAENLPPKSYHWNVLILEAPETRLAQLKQELNGVVNGKPLKFKNGELRAYLKSKLGSYNACFWMGVNPDGMYFLPATMRLEMAEVIPTSNWSSRKSGETATSKFLKFGGLTMGRLAVPRRSYLDSPKSVDSFVKILLHNMHIIR